MYCFVLACTVACPLDSVNKSWSLIFLSPWRPPFQLHHNWIEKDLQFWILYNFFVFFPIYAQGKGMLFDIVWQFQKLTSHLLGCVPKISIYWRDFQLFMKWNPPLTSGIFIFFYKCNLYCVNICEELRDHVGVGLRKLLDYYSFKGIKNLFFFKLSLSTFSVAQELYLQQCSSFPWKIFDGLWGQIPFM